MQIMPPAAADYGFYNGYFLLAPKTELTAALKANMEEIKAFALSLSEEELAYRYAEGKWSIKEIFTHFVDAERNFCYRIMRISRSDKGILPPMDIHSFVMNSNAANRNMEDILAELEHLRAATILLFKSMSPEMLDVVGPAHSVMISPRALGYILVGHSLHHFAVIREKYLSANPV